jgi:hypothetical protein
VIIEPAKHYGGEDPMGRTLSVDRAFDDVVTGIVQGPPSNSSPVFDLLSPFKLLLLAPGVLAANLIAWPAARYFMGRWLQGFACRAALSPWPFVVSGAIALGIALVTVVSLTARAAAAGPTDALRYE